MQGDPTLTGTTRTVISVFMMQLGLLRGRRLSIGITYLFIRVTAHGTKSLFFTNKFYHFFHFLKHSSFIKV